MKLALLGAGRIGRVHAGNVSANPRAVLSAVADVNFEAAKELADKHGARAYAEAEQAMADPEIDGVMICSSTDTHVEMIELAAQYGKPVFCEKPIDLDLARVDACLEKVAAAGVPLMIGFNRRFDPHFSALERALAAGEIGKIEVLKITSRDPEPPPAGYVAVSGGIFRDMTIHDLDMARFLLPDEPREVYAAGSCLVSPDIGRAGDVDTAVVILKTAGGVICQIDNSRRAVYGYDQRIEALGEKGMLQAGNPSPTTLARYTQAAVTTDKPPYFFLERYAEAYRAELDNFLDVVAGKAEPAVDGQDGRAALMLADAAARSLAENRTIQLEV
ncbi:MAG TPA: inositol 2-dehydrogenase [Myxococcota bacterium]|nr:inositol 2-dehydrogenase [Myxococcota bacterium]